MKTVLGKIQGLGPIIATVICIALAGLMWLPVNQIASQDVRPTPQASTEPSADVAADILADGAQALLERPLFHVTRRQPVAQETVQAAPVQVTLTLTGVLNNGDVDIALLRLSNGPDLLRGRVGDQIGGWEIVDITKTAVTVLNPDGQEQVIGLSSSNN